MTLPRDGDDLTLKFNYRGNNREVLGGKLSCQVGPVATGQVAVSRDQFPPKKGDLIALCQATKDDPLMTSAVNFCNGFAEGAVAIALGYEIVARKDRQPFCLPTPRPSHNEAVAQFAAWANSAPGRGIGAAGGAVIGALAGNAALGAGIGAGAGLLGGLLVNSWKNNEQQSYEEGYHATTIAPAPLGPCLLTPGRL